MKRLLLHLHAAETGRYQSALITLMEAVMMGKMKDSEIVAAARKATGHYTMARAYEHALEIHQRKEARNASPSAADEGTRQVG